jgi:hypothetical protein
MRVRPAFAALLILLLALAAAGLVAARMDGGRFVYPLDDTYIHMAMARSFSGHGVWGITPDGFASTSSSPLWTLILSLVFLIFGPNAAAPLFLNALAAAALLYALDSLFKRFGLAARERFFALLAVIVFTPLVPLVFCGLEHVLHALLTVLFVDAVAAALSASPPSASARNRIFLLAPLLVAARFESLFLIGLAALLFLVRKRIFSGAATLLLGLAPLGILGLISISQGWYFLPNSVLLKGRLPNPLSLKALAALLGAAAAAAWSNPHVLVLAAAVLAVNLLPRAKRPSKSEHWEGGPPCGGTLVRFRRRGPSAAPMTAAAEVPVSVGRPQSIFALLFLSTLAAHVLFAQLGWFYRYEGYLMVLGTAALVLGVRDLWPALAHSAPAAVRLPALLALLFVVLVLGIRGVRATLQIPQASRNIFEQQVQMASFIRGHCEGAAVALNDIGAVIWYANIRCLDLWGLADINVARARLAGTYGPETMAALAKARGVRIAVVYPEWFDRFGGLPAGWIQVGRWTIEDNIVCGGPTVVFYAVRPEEAKPLAEALASFQADLPPRVAWRIVYK